MEKRWRRLAAFFAATTLLMALVSDWPGGWLRGVWGEYAMITGVISGFLLLAVTVVFVEAFLERRDSAKWEAVAHTAFRGLGEAVGDVGEALEVVVTGRVRPGRNRFDAPWGPEFHDRVLASALPDVPDNRYGDDDFQDFYPVALRRRLEDPEWCDLAQRATVAIRGAHRIRITPWLPAMLATGELARIQNRVALLDRRLMRLQGPVLELARMGSAETHKDKTREEFIELAYNLWQATHLEAVALAEGLYRASREGSQYVHRDEPARHRLDDRHLSYLVGRDDDLASELSQPFVPATIDGDLGADYQVVTRSRT